MKIDQLPFEMLMKIFSYLTAYWEVSLVNKLFYSIASKVNDRNICLRINRRFFERFLCDDVKSCQLLQSIQSSNRRISKVEICDSNRSSSFLIEHQTFFIAVFQRFSATIKILVLRRFHTDESTFLEILSLIPNLEILCIDRIGFAAENQSSKRSPHYNNELNLKKLRSLTVFGGNDELVTILNRLPAGVLTELNVDNEHWNSLATLFNRQFNIKNLILFYARAENEDELATDIFDKLELESLELNVARVDSATIARVLSKQTKLKSLILSGHTVTDETVTDVVATLLELEVLGMDVTLTSAASFEKVRKLKKLQDLRLKSRGNGITVKFETLVESDNSMIKKLHWLGYASFKSRMSDDVIGALAKSAPHLTHLYYSCSGLSAEQNAVMRNFNFVEVLQIGIFAKPPAEPDNYFNPKLSELIVQVGHHSVEVYTSWLLQFIAAYPNLKKLQLNIVLLKTPMEIRPILEGFTKLESLILRVYRQSTLKDLYCLLDYNLKFVSLGDLEEVTADVLVKNMSAGVKVLTKDNDCPFTPCILHAAVDRYTMNEHILTSTFHRFPL